MNKSVCLSVTLSGHVIVDRFSLTLPETGCLCLFGPSGCGKTTLLRALGGLLPAQFEPENPWQGKKTAILFQEDRLFPWMTVKENIQCVQKKPARVLSLPDELGLDGLLERYPHEISGGQCRRVALARALCYGGDVLLLDEPFQGLDRPRIEAILPLLQREKAKKPVLLITHDQWEAKALADQILWVEGPPLRLKTPDSSENLQKNG
ncbi:MAG: ATP-binding cassette domain-containing protein [Acutalibacteraceae bacterium]